ncbi:DUF58 domain-containing protein [Halobellus salinisoli]|uniref:DUF58 domain-containing protein n=1 Tax=Halobellus salinisoli TaxID=3108500 RepID=UPI00300B3B88
MTPAIRPTRRGYAVLGVAIGAFAAGALFGPRTLDAVVLPAAVALLAGVVQVWRTQPPEFQRRLPSPDEPGTIGTVEVHLSASRPYPITVRDRLPSGIESETGGSESTAVVDATTDGDAITYEIVRRRRGRHEIGPASVVVTDVLGLLRRTYEIDVRDTVAVYPSVRSLPEAIRGELTTVARTRRPGGRDEFDTLREYVSGDSLRDVHWKSSAKRSELVVREFASDAEFETVTVAAETASKSNDAVGHSAATSAVTPTDAMATAAATVCLALVNDGAAVALATPSGRVEASPGRTRPLLEHLAVAKGGTAETASVDVRILADDESVAVRFDGRARDFEGIVTDRADSSAQMEGSVTSGGGTATSGEEGRT